MGIRFIKSHLIYCKCINTLVFPVYHSLKNFLIFEAIFEGVYRRDEIMAHSHNGSSVGHPVSEGWNSTPRAAESRDPWTPSNASRFQDPPSHHPPAPRDHSQGHRGHPQGHRDHSRAHHHRERSRDPHRDYPHELPRDHGRHNDFDARTSNRTAFPARPARHERPYDRPYENDRHRYNPY